MAEIYVWCETYAPKIEIALKDLDFTEKTIRIVTTHEGSGLANVLNDVKRICKGANILNNAIAIRGADCKNARSKIEKESEKCNYYNKDKKSSDIVNVYRIGGKKNMDNEIILFENQDVKLEVNIKDETVWLNANQMAELFGRDVKTIRKHINNALKEELYDEVVVANFASTTKHGAIEGRTQTHIVDYYNLDMIISVGYRVKSKKGIVFRKWANKILKDYMLKGYAINQKRLEYLEKTIKIIDIASRIDERLEGDDAKEILKVIGNYSKALDMLYDYDHRTLKKIKGTTDTRIIKYDDCIDRHYK